MARHPKSIITIMTLSICLGGAWAGLGAITITAQSCSDVAVQVAIDAAQDGDTVAIPAGTCTWKKTVNLGTQTAWTPPAYNTKALVIRGAGQDSTIIIDSIPTPASGNPRGTMLSIATKLGGFTRVTGMTFNSRVYTNLDTFVYNPAMISIGGYSHTWRIDHMHFIVGVGNGITTGGSTYGVIDHNTFDLHGWHFGMYIFHSNWNGQSNGDGAWNDSLYAGTEKYVFIEDNVFNASPYSVAIDGWSGGRAVFRHNTLHNATIANHGLDSPGRLRSMRAMEIYNNTVTLDDSAQYYYLGQLRGGTFIIFNNTLTSKFPGAFTIENYRDYDTFDPWGKCDGTSPWDVNDSITYDSGVCTGASGSKTMVCAGKAWTANQWQGYHVHNITKGQSDLIVSNTADTIKTSGLTWHAPVLTWNNGDSFKILRATVCMDQRGRGIGDLISGDAPPYGTGIAPVGWPHQMLEPTYTWNNTVNGDTALGKTGSQNPWRIKEGREFFNSPMPEYTPYTYPHPLVNSGAKIIAMGRMMQGQGLFSIKLNHFNSSVSFTFNNPQTDARISIFSVDGQRVAILNNIRTEKVEWKKNVTAPGIYTVKLQIGGEAFTQRICLIR